MITPCDDLLKKISDSCRLGYIMIIRFLLIELNMNIILNFDNFFQTVMELQKKLPKARIVYASATGATEPRHMAYMVRLGIWGEGSPFRDFGDFLAAVEKRYVFWFLKFESFKVNSLQEGCAKCFAVHITKMYLILFIFSVVSEPWKLWLWT